VATRLPPLEDPYSQHEAYLGEVPLPGVSALPGRAVGLHLRLHVAAEAYRDPPAFARIAAPTGTRVYVHARPYALVPDLQLTIGLAAAGTADELVGRVLGGGFRGWRRHDVGAAEAWRYPAAGTLVVWEAVLDPQHRAAADPQRDPAQALRWAGFEAARLRHLPPWGRVEHLVATWEDAYPRPVWAAFLDGHGYRPRPPTAFVKRLLPGAGG